ncbi:MAG: hypothetical protein QM654_16105 [Dysgonamonadaceae bacterium]
MKSKLLRIDKSYRRRLRVYIGKCGKKLKTGLKKPGQVWSRQAKIREMG